jgi:hypothetical protein
MKKSHFAEAKRLANWNTGKSKSCDPGSSQFDRSLRCRAHSTSVEKEPFRRGEMAGELEYGQVEKL